MPMPVLLAAALGCRGGDTPTCDSEAQRDAPAEQGPDGENLLILVLDDVGVDKLAVYGVHDTPSPTPRINALFEEGVRFDRAYASPTCSPTRASMLTGRHPSRHGIGQWIWPSEDTYSLPEDELTFAEVASDAGWSTALVGKWHLSAVDGHDAAGDPQRQGFDHFRGLVGNPTDAVHPDGNRRGYTHWEHIVDGEPGYTDRYLTTVEVDDTLALLATLPEPWVVYVGFSAAHVPLDLPPPALALPASDDPLDRYDAVLEALDTELGRLLDDMGDDLRARTTILTIGDNGTEDHAIRPPWDPLRGKSTMYEGGIRVPLSIAGPLVREPGTVSGALVHAVDVFATVADLVGVDLASLPVVTDGVSLLPRLDAASDAGTRRCLLSEQFTPDGDVRRDTLDRAVVEDGVKLVRRLHEPDLYLGVTSDPSAETEIGDRQIGAGLRSEMRRYERALD